MKIGNKNITKKVFNNKVVLKEVLNGSTIYENASAENPYLTFSSNNSFTLEVVDHLKYWDGTIEYSTDTTTWNTWDGTTALSSVNNKLYLRGTGNSYIISDSISITANNPKAYWVLTGSNINCNGNIENLLDYQTVANGNHPTMAAFCYNYMFYNCTALISAPKLKAVDLSACCYYGMFVGCSNLTVAPKLHATTLKGWCYNYMFMGCTNLTTIPNLPAITLTDYCYTGMFYGCSKIKLSTTQTGEYTQVYRIPTSGTGTTATSALDTMFNNTGGTFTGTPTINTTYYLSNTNTIV